MKKIDALAENLGFVSRLYFQALFGISRRVAVAVYLLSLDPLTSIAAIRLFS